MKLLNWLYAFLRTDQSQEDTTSLSEEDLLLEQSRMNSFEFLLDSLESPGAATICIDDLPWIMDKLDSHYQFTRKSFIVEDIPGKPTHVTIRENFLDIDLAIEKVRRELKSERDRELRKEGRFALHMLKSLRDSGLEDAIQRFLEPLNNEDNSI